MIACPLCEALFTRYEIAIDYDFDNLLPMLRRALRKHGRQAHDTKMLIDVSMYFTSFEVYRRWIDEQMNPQGGRAWGVRRADEGQDEEMTKC